MKLPLIEYPFVFLTACFSGTWAGKDATVSELRVPALRGHLRIWHRVLYGAREANLVWGNASGNEGSGSRVAVTLKSPPPPSTTKADILPHKSTPYQRGGRPALPANSQATLVLQRLPGCSAQDWEHAQHAVRLWLLLGALGNRSSRAAGSVWPGDSTAPGTPDALHQQLDALGCKWAVALAPSSIGSSWESLRTAASDTPADKISFGSSAPRTPSPTRFKVVRFGNDLRLLIFAPTPERLSQAQKSMITKPAPALSKPREWERL